MKKVCQKTNLPFTIREADKAFYQKMDLPLPVLHPYRRQQERLAWMESFRLFRRRCSATQKSIISIYPPETPFPVYHPSYWWSDAWNAYDYGQDFDFSRPFFPQFFELWNRVPKISLLQRGENQNAEYCVNSGWNKNSYLLFSSHHNEDCLYGYWLQQCIACTDCAFLMQCEQCYESINCGFCFRCFFSQNCENSSYLWFCKNCINCKHCFGCVNLRDKEYYFFNKPLSKEAYEKALSELHLHKWSSIKALKEKFNALKRQFPHRATEGWGNESVVGAGNYYCKQLYHCAYCENAEYCAYSDSLVNTKEAYDVSYCVGAHNHHLYFSAQLGFSVQHIRFSRVIFDHCAFIDYSQECYQSQHLFGCTGIKGGKYSILNKSYTKAEYEKLKNRIIAHMKETGEWGQFFPVSYSPFSYQDSLAQEFFPREISQAKKEGFRTEELPDATYQGPDKSPPDDIEKINPSALSKEIFRCQQSGKPFRIIPAEIAFHQKFHLPFSPFAPLYRQQQRARNTTKHILYATTCHRCGKSILSSINPKEGTIIWCEDCFDTQALS